MLNYDLIIIGSGPGGYVAAIRAAQLGIKTLIVEKADLGGVCLNWGCIPTKALLRSAEIFDYTKKLSVYGIDGKDIHYNLSDMIKRSRGIADKLSKGVAYLLKKNNVTFVYGHAKFISSNELTVSGSDGIKKYIAKNIIIATGARPKTLIGASFDHENIWNYKDAMIPKDIPKKLAIIGSGAIGVEYASFYNALGVNVTVFESLDRIVPSEDYEISATLESIMKKNGILFKKNTLVTKVSGVKSVAIEYSSDGVKGKDTFDKVLIAIGITANTENLDLEKTKVKIEANHIVTYANGQTDEKNVYAIGDVAGIPWLAHKASHEGIKCVEFIAGESKQKNKLDIRIIPACTYTNPQIASIGLTEEAAKLEGIVYRVGKFPLSANGKALSLGEPDGYIKTLFNTATGEILGAHLIGSEVTELINSFALAMKMEATEEDIMETIFPHPTLSESIHESVLNAYNKGIHN